jgi:hypothetical protein
MEEADLAKHWPDATHLEVNPLDRLPSPHRIGREELAGLLGEVLQDRTRLSNSGSGAPPGPFGSRMAGILPFGLSDTNSGVF